MVEWAGVRHFSRAEFGDGEPYVEPCSILVAKLDQAREMAGVPFVITSGLRTEAHNERVGGAPGSAHIGGYAADIAAQDSTRRMAVLSAVLAVGFTRVGVGRSFIHVDTDPSKPQGVCWLY